MSLEIKGTPEGATPDSGGRESEKRRRVVVFGGTTEGREEALRLFRTGEDVLVSVTSGYARALLPEGIPCHVGALNREEMMHFLREEAPGLVIDATHPFAALVTENLRACCQALSIPLQRVARPQSAGKWRDSVLRVRDAEAAALALRDTSGNVLLTTGSRTLAVYAAEVPKERLFVRVLPTSEALSLCDTVGILPSHIIAMQGPFSAALNAALYDLLEIRVLVTKDSGKRGGVEEKAVPALSRGILVILIDRPEEETCGESR